MEAILSRIEANMQTKDDAKAQMGELQQTVGKITKEFNDKLQRFQEDNDKKYEECSAAIKELREQFEEFRKGVDAVSGDRGTKRPCNSATRASSADAGRTGGGGARELKQEVKEKLERRVTVGGFIGNSDKDVREKAVKRFLESLGVMDNYGKHEVFAKGATGSEVVIQFESRMKASQFIKDNLEAIKKFKVQGKASEHRDTFFSLHLNEEEWKVYHATRLLAKKLTESKQFHPMAVKPYKHKGVVAIHDFDIVRIKVGTNGALEYKYLHQNIKDLDVEGLEEKLKAMVKDFDAKFE